jgi:hypothetical protein
VRNRLGRKKRFTDIRPKKSNRAQPYGRGLRSCLPRSRRIVARRFELNRELDQIGIFKDYEDRFLDLFKKSN